jgi:hypothetical protein
MIISLSIIQIRWKKIKPALFTQDLNIQVNTVEIPISSKRSLNVYTLFFLTIIMMLLERSNHSLGLSVIVIPVKRVMILEQNTIVELFVMPVIEIVVLRETLF